MLLMLSCSASPLFFSPDDLIVAEKEQLRALVKTEPPNTTQTEKGCGDTDKGDTREDTHHTPEPAYGKKKRSQYMIDNVK